MATERLRLILLHVGFHHFIFSTNGVGALSSWKDYNNSPYETGSDTFGRFIQAVDFSRLFFLLQCCFSSWVSATLQLGNRPPPSTGWLGTWSWKFLPLLLIFSSGPSFRINLQYQPSGGGWCIPHTPQIYALVWLPLIQSDSQSSPGGFSHTDGFDFGATQVWSYSERSTEEKSHMYNENILKGFRYHSTTKCSSLNEVMLSFWIHIGKKSQLKSLWDVLPRQQRE